MNITGGPGRDPAAPGAKKKRFFEEREETPLVPGLSSWRSVYWFVLAFFALCIVLMRALQDSFS